MRSIILMIALLCSLLALNGCAPLMVASGALSAKSAYESYETLSSLKNVQEETPTLGTYRNIFISFNVQPRDGNGEEVSRLLEEIYARSVMSLAAKNELDVLCRAYEPKTAASGKDALVIQVREQKPSFLKRMVSGDKIHAVINYIDRKSAMVIAEQVDVAGNYEEMIHHLILSVLAKLEPPVNSNQTAWTTAITYFQGRNDSVIMTEKERSILRRG